MDRHHDGRFAKQGEAISAEAALAAKQAELLEREAGSSHEGGPVKLHPLYAAYISHLERKGRDPKTVSRNRCSLARLQVWLDELGVDPKDATEVVLEEYVSWLAATLAEMTANREVAHVKAAFRYAVRLGMLDKNPADDIEAPKVSETEPETYTNEELRRIRAVIRDNLEEIIFYALAYGGLRRHELVELTWNAVDFENQFMTVRGKGGKLRRIPIHPALADVLAAQRRRCPSSDSVLGHGGSPRNVNARIATLVDRAGVEGGNRPAHKFRKTAATALFEEGVQTDIIDKILGWAPSSVRSRHYTRLPDRSLYQGVLRLYASDPIERAPLRASDSGVAHEAGVAYR
ncbi:MAG: tyrosine-type recombinase/integrase [Gaiellaceae bacterium]|jgi:integrase